MRAGEYVGGRKIGLERVKLPGNNRKKHTAFEAWQKFEIKNNTKMC
jgi:hypothetical protein